MKNKRSKLRLQRETVRQITIQEVQGGFRAIGPIDDIGSADLCKSCLCVSDPESVCLCSGGGGVRLR